MCPFFLDKPAVWGMRVLEDVTGNPLAGLEKRWVLLFPLIGKSLACPLDW
jgi:hypothetical protein